MRRHPAIGILASVAAALTLAACADGEPLRSDGERIVLGDTTIVVAGDPVWGDAVELVEEVSFGVLEGEPEYEFGAFLELAVDGSGGIYVFDGQVPALRYYDASGVYVRTLGRGGSGPGEYGDAALGLTVRQSDGRVVLRDGRNARLNVYSVEGSPLVSWPVANPLFTARAMTRDTADHLYLKVLTGPPAEGPFDPARIWEFSPLGGFWVGVTDQYVLEHHRPDGTVLRVTRDLEPIPLQPDERSEWLARSEWMARAGSQAVPSIPAEKPLYRAMIAGEDGRLWVRLFAQAEKEEDSGVAAPPGRDGPPPRTWWEPLVYDVFEPDGTYLGQIRPPPGTALSVRRGEHVWGVRRDELGTPSVVRFRIVAGG